MITSTHPFIQGLALLCITTVAAIEAATGHEFSPAVYGGLCAIGAGREVGKLLPGGK